MKVRVCKLCGEKIYDKAKNLGKSKHGKKRTYWAHPECINNMRKFVSKLQDENYMKQIKEEAKYYGRNKGRKN